MNTAVSSKPNFPWQLYFFSILHLLGGIFVVFFDVCNLLTGSGQNCTSTEHITALMLGLTCLWVGVFFTLLTYRGRDDGSKLKRLAMLATDCSAALFAGVVMTGNAKFGGFEKSSFHLADMIFFFSLFLIMQSETHSDAPAAKSTPLKNGFGCNCKALILLLLVIITLKLFFMSDIMTVDYLFEDSDEEQVTTTTALARFFWDWSIIILFEALLATAFVLYYGDFYDQEAFIIAIVALEVVSFLYSIPIWGAVRADLLPKSLISMFVFIALCVITIYVGRKQQQRGGYEQVLSTNV